MFNDSKINKGFLKNKNTFVQHLFDLLNIKKKIDLQQNITKNSP
jgi:hypothetical protein